MIAIPVGHHVGAGRRRCSDTYADRLREWVGNVGLIYVWLH